VPATTTAEPSGAPGGEFRESQNWIGGTRPGTAAFVPPPPELVLDCMSALERFLHDERADLPLLVKAGLVHVQFETIHPFLDGNGRLGRLLITFLLCAAGVLREPILYLSLYFKQHRPAYYELLDRVGFLSAMILFWIQQSCAIPKRPDITINNCYGCTVNEVIKKQ
jgi:Fic family protein